MSSEDNRIYIPLADYGLSGRAYAETDEDSTRENLIQDILDGQIDPIDIVAFDPDLSDVSKDIAQEVIDRAWGEGIMISPAIRRFAEFHDVDVPEITGK